MLHRGEAAAQILHTLAGRRHRSHIAPRRSPMATWFDILARGARDALPRALSERVLWLCLTVVVFALCASFVQRRTRRGGGRAARRISVLDRGGVGRNALAAGVATMADFMLALSLLHFAVASPAVATFGGCALGAVVNFAMNRAWTFRSDGSPTREAWRYLLVSASSAAFNAALVHVLLLPNVPFVASWVLARGAVFLAWNYPLHRDYVFVRAAS
jgi:putative flippase GtrA